jgi:ankyrin repeat protein
VQTCATLFSQKLFNLQYCASTDSVGIIQHDETGASLSTMKQSKQNPAVLPPCLTQPEEMKTNCYVYGVEKLNGHDAWALFEACGTGNVRKVKQLLRKDQRLVNAQYWYQFPIHLAVFAGHSQIVELLLKHGADPGQSRYTYDSWDKLLASARQRGYRQIESILLKAMEKRFNYTPDFEALKTAIIARDLRKITAMLRRRPELVRSSDALGNNALHWSVITRRLDLLELFVKLGTPIDALRADGQTPALLAVNGATDYWYRDTRGRSHPSLRNTSVLVGSLLAHGAHYSISVAAAIGDQERVAHLLKKDSTLARRLDSARGSPLSYAAREGHLHIVRLLLEHGADPNMPEDSAPEGAALFNACCGNHIEVARLLLEHGANPNAGTDSSGCCLTISAVYHGEKAKPLQKLLRQHGAYQPPYAMSLQELKKAIRDAPQAVAHEEFFACLLAKRNAKLLDHYFASYPTAPVRLWSGAYPRSPKLVRRLLHHGLAPDCPDWLGRTFLHFCAANADQAIAELFLKAGAEINIRDLESKGTPLAIAIRSSVAQEKPKQAERRRKMVEFLLKRGAAPNLPGDEPWATPSPGRANEVSRKLKRFS